MVEAQVEHSPEASALVNAENKTMSYRELNQEANKLAHYLRHVGNARGALIGICIERSFEMVISVLGT